jgi:hypothetical protein
MDKKYKDFDFWIGEWTVYAYGTENIAGHSKIEPILNGMVIKETYETPGGQYKGTSLNKYNPAENRWEQYWVDNTGLTLHITGDLMDGKMVLSNESNDQNGLVRNRITWTPMEDGTVRQQWDTQRENDDKWTSAFDGLYKKK